MADAAQARSGWPLRAALALAFLEVFSFGYCLRSLGWYLDDWPLLEHVHAPDGFSFGHGLRTLWSQGVSPRLFSIPIYAAVYSLSGSSPLPAHVLQLAANALAATLGCLWLERLIRDRRVALLAASLWLLLPVHAATHHWVSQMLQPIALAAGFAALIVHHAALERRRLDWLALSGALFCAAFLTKETISFFPILAAIAAYDTHRRRGDAPAQAAKRLPLDLLPLAVGFGAGMLWQFFVKGGAQTQSVGGSPAWAAAVYGAALDSLTLQALKLMRLAGGAFVGAADDARLLLLLLFSGVATWLATRPEPAGEGALKGSPPGALKGSPPGDDRLRTGLAFRLAAGFFAAAYAPYAASGGYSPSIVGGMSRTNEVGAWSLALALAVALPWAAERAAAALGGRLRPRALLAAGLWPVVAASTATNWYIAEQWAGSWRLQQEVLGRLERWAPKLPPKSTVLVPGIPPHVNGTEVFHEGTGDWAFGFAFKLRSGRRDVETILPTGRLVGTPKGVVEERPGLAPRLIPYAGLHQFDFAADKLTRVVP